MTQMLEDQLSMKVARACRCHVTVGEGTNRGPRRVMLNFPTGCSKLCFLVAIACARVRIW